MPYSVTRNAVFQALQRKYNQIEKAGYAGIKGIILCDAGASIIRHTIASAAAYSLEDILREFFQSHPAVSFVVTLFVQREGLSDSTYHIRGGFAHSPSATHPVPLPLKEEVTRIPEFLPKPVSDGLNARVWIASHRAPLGKSFFGGYQMTDKTVRISVRAVQELLAGRVDQNRFLTAHGFAPAKEEPVALNPFEKALSEGRLIEKIEVEKVEDKDDDWLTFHFGDADAAISKIKKPKR